MENGIYIALSRQTALRRQLDVVAHNIANVNTPAFKGEKMLFVEHLSKAQAGYDESANGKHFFVRDIGQVRDVSEGPMLKTGNDLDVGIIGEGYFSVETEQGRRYTRHGRFLLNENRELITSPGHVVQSDGGGSIVVPPTATSISITPDGAVASGDQILGKLSIVTFADQQKLQRDPNNMYSTDQAEQPAATARLVQGMLEQSNVNPIIELTQMIDIHRTHDSVKRMIDDEHDRIRRMIGRLGQAGRGS